MAQRLKDGLPLPKYYRVKESVREMIRARGLQEGEMIPPERELCERYGVSRMTARQAVMELVNEGVLYREQGRGTFVAGQKLQHETARLTSFTQDMKMRGMEVSSEVLEVAEVPAPPAAARALGLGPDEPVVRIRRVRSAEDQPMALETSHLLYELGRGVLAADLTKGSLYEWLARRGVRIARAEQSYEATLVNDGEARHLGVPAGSAALLIERVTFDGGDRPFEYVKSVYRGDRYRVTTVLEP